MGKDVSRATKNCSACDTPHERNHCYCLSCHNSYMRSFRKQRPLTPEQRMKDACRSYAGVYLRRGKISKEPCIECGSAKSQMHHADYSKPLQVTWLCRPCHLQHHQHEDAA